VIGRFDSHHVDPGLRRGFRPPVHEIPADAGINACGPARRRRSPIVTPDAAQRRSRVQGGATGRAALPRPPIHEIPAQAGIHACSLVRC